jgi:uracil-DNA glycosylase
MAHGLCFSVDPGVRKLPTSLRNIFRERESDLGLAIPPTGCLLPWAAQGVLMLNTILTVREGRPLSHASRGWETFTDAVIKEVSERRDFVVFVLWGKAAQSKQPLIAPRHARVTAAHPSPLSARGFFGSSPFSTVNRLLRDAGKPVVDWTLR